MPDINQMRGWQHEGRAGASLSGQGESNGGSSSPAPGRISGRRLFRKIQRIHLVGIGGSGMSGIAEVLLTLGYQVSGSDLQNSETVRRLRELGGRICLGHDASHIGDAQVVVISSAVGSTNPEVQAAKP